MKLFVCILAASLIAAATARPELGYAYAPPISTGHLGVSSNINQVATSYNPPASGSNYNQHQHHQHHQQHVATQQVATQQLPAVNIAQAYAPVAAPSQVYAPAAVQQQQYVQQQQQQFIQQPQQSFIGNTATNTASASHQYTNTVVNTASVPTIVQKHIYVHVPPPDTEADQAAALAQQQLVQPKKHYKIIFIKAPAPPSNLPSPAALAQAQAATEEKTIVYVLVKKPDEQSDYEAAASAIPPPPPSKPEVYFIKYKNQATAAAVPAGANLGVDVRHSFGGAALEQELSGAAAQQQQQTVITTTTTTSQQHSHGEQLAASQSQQAGHVHVPAPVYGPAH